MTEKDDNQLLKDYLDGDIKGFETLYARHKGGTYRFFLRQTDLESAEDLMQELWKKVVTNAESYEFSAKFNTWLYRMARNLVIDRHRHLSVVQNVMVTNNDDDEDHSDAHHNSESDGKPQSDQSQPDRQLNSHLQQQVLLGCMQKLPMVQMECFVLKQDAGFTHAEIAQIVGGSLEAIKSRVKTAVKSLRDCVTSQLSQEVA